MSSLKQPESFPAKELLAVLSTWYDKKVASPFGPKLPNGSSFDIQPELSSQQAVIVLLDCEKLLGYTPDNKVIKRGGYIDKKEFLTTMMQRLQKEWETHQLPAVATTAMKENSIHAAP